MEKVNHPLHYNVPGKKECIEQMLDDYGPYITVVFCLTSAYKYLYRMGYKPGESAKEDLQKANWYYDYATNLARKYFHYSFEPRGQDTNLEALWDTVSNGLNSFE